jgi:hypothetical protein
MWCNENHNPETFDDLAAIVRGDPRATERTALPLRPEFERQRAAANRDAAGACYIARRTSAVIS